MDTGEDGNMEQENKIMIGRIAAAFVLTVAGAFLPDA